MSDRGFPLPSLFHEVRDKINERLDSLVANNLLSKYRHEVNGLRDFWYVTPHGDGAEEHELRSVREIMCFLKGFEARDAFQRGLDEYLDISNRLDSLFSRGILSLKGAIGYPSGDWYVCVKETSEEVYLANKQEALDFLAKYEQ